MILNRRHTLLRVSLLLGSRRHLYSSAVRHQAQSASKGGNEEKWAQGAMEFIYEMNQANSKKTARDVEVERHLSCTFDRYLSNNEKVFNHRMNRLIERMSEAATVLQSLGMQETLAEATMLNSEHLPLNYRRPSLTPPLPGYEPAFGMDVPQLKSHQMEYPPIQRVSDKIEFENVSDSFPFVGCHEVDHLAQSTDRAMGKCAAELCTSIPVTGADGEAWSAHRSLQSKALARQRLLIDLGTDDSLREKYEESPSFRDAELRSRNIEALRVEPERTRHERLHFAHEPAHHPYRGE